MSRPPSRTYVKFREVLYREIEKMDLQEPISLRLSLLGVGDKDTIKGLLEGKRKPNEHFIEHFSAARFPKKDDSYHKLVKELTQLAELAPIDPMKSLFADSGVGTLRKLKVIGLKYEPFAGSPTEFLETVFDRFFKLAGFETDVRHVGHSYKKSSHEDADVLLGFLDSPNRILGLDVKFWRLPIRLGLGAICAKRSEYATEKIARVLSGLDPKSRAVQPVVVAEEVGYLHCRHRLGYTDNEIIHLPNLDYDVIAKHLLSHRPSGNEPIPVVVLDEFSAMTLLSKMDENPNDNYHAFSVFPMNSRRANQDQRNATRRELPQYYLTLATRPFLEPIRNTFYNDALIQFLSTEIETTARRLVDLAKRLAEILGAFKSLPCDVPFAAATTPGGTDLFTARRTTYIWEWIVYALSLDSESIDSFATFNYLPWRPILRRARQLLHRYWSETPELINLLVDSLWISGSGGDRLVRLLDFDKDKLFKSWEETDDPQTIVKLICHQLVEAQPNRKFDVEEHNVNDLDKEKPRLAIIAFIQSVQAMYVEQGHPEVHQPMTKDIKALQSQSSDFAGDTGTVLLAISKDDPWVFRGGICLRWFKSTQCELRYLWVEQRSRRTRVGAQIIHKAIETAKKNPKCELIFAEILSDLLPHAASLFEKCGFKRCQMDETSKRTRFEKALVS